MTFLNLKLYQSRLQKLLNLFQARRVFPFLLWLLNNNLESIKSNLFHYWFLQILWMIGELPETIETWLIFHVVIWQRNGELSLRSFWFKIIRIVSLTGICIFFCPNFLFCSTKWKCIKQRILWHTPEFAEFKTGELWKSWSEVDKSWRKLSQQHDPSCSPDFGLQVNPLPSLLIYPKSL